MELRDIFHSNKYRNILLEILSYLTYDEISNLLCLDQTCRDYMKQFLCLDENWIVLGPIVDRRFFDRGKCKFRFNDSFVQPKFTISNDKIFWKRYYPNIQDGDIIYLSKCDKFIHINTSKLFVRYEWNKECQGKNYRFVFPIDYWRTIGKIYPFRLWITVKVYYESLKVWMTQKNIRFIDLDLNPNLYDHEQEIEICFTYVEDLIYIYNARK